jgi:hypothetical protein
LSAIRTKRVLLAFFGFPGIIIPISFSGSTGSMKTDYPEAISHREQESRVHYNNSKHEEDEYGCFDLE